MKKFFAITSLMLVFVSISFGIDVPKDSIYRFISETATKNNLKNPNQLSINQSLDIYLGSYVKMPVRVNVEDGQNLTVIIKNTVKNISELEMTNRNLMADMIKAESIASMANPPTPDQPKIPMIVKWSILGISLVVLIAVIDLVKRIKKK